MVKDAGSVILDILNSARGDIYTADYPDIALAALIIKWVELKNKEEGFAAYKEIYAPSRLAATYGTADGPSDVIDYLLQFEKAQSDVKGGYIGEIAGALTKVPPKAFSDILTTLSGLTLDNCETLYTIAVDFMMSWSRLSGKNNSIGMSSDGIHNIERIALGETGESERVFDGFAGTGIGTITATAGKGYLTLQEKVRRSASWAEMMCILKGCKAKINVCDSLASGEGGEPFDKVIMEAPFGVRALEYKDLGLSYYDPDYDMMCIRYALSKMDKGGRGVILCPAGVLFKGGRTGDSRRELIENSYIDAVIQLPAGAVLGTAVQTAILILGKNKKSSKVMVVDASKLLSATDKGRDFILSAENAAVLQDIIYNRKVIENISQEIDKTDIVEHDYSLVVNQYIETSEETDNEIDLSAALERKSDLEKRLGQIDKELAVFMKKFS